MLLCSLYDVKINGNLLELTNDFVLLRMIPYWHDGINDDKFDDKGDAKDTKKYNDGWSRYQSYREWCWSLPSQ